MEALQILIDLYCFTSILISDNYDNEPEIFASNYAV